MPLLRDRSWHGILPRDEWQIDVTVNDVTLRGSRAHFRKFRFRSTVKIRVDGQLVEFAEVWGLWGICVTLLDVIL